MPLHHGTHLLALEKGPFADLARFNLELQLVELDLRANDDGLVYPVSTIRVRGADGRVEESVLTPWRSATHGDLRFYQGAYGFAPRIVVRRDGETLVDDVVPFTTEARGSGVGVGYEGSVTASEHDLEVRGAVDTGTLDEAMRGHVALALEVRLGDRALGAGRLLPGHFADLDDGYQVGFAGMEQWSEIDFSRRNYRRVSLVGFGLALSGMAWMLVSRVLTMRRRRGDG